MKAVVILSVFLITVCLNTTAYGFLVLLACWFITRPKIRVLGHISCSHKILQYSLIHEPLCCVYFDPSLSVSLTKTPHADNSAVALATLTPNRCPERRHEQGCWGGTEPLPTGKLQSQQVFSLHAPQKQCLEATCLAIPNPFPDSNM